MPRLRFNVRSLMILVAFGAMVFGGETMRRRQVTYMKRAASERGLVQFHRKDAEACEQSAPLDVAEAIRQRGVAEVHRQRAASRKGDSQYESRREEIHQEHSENAAVIYQIAADEKRLLAKRNRAQATYHEELARKYELAVRQPWWKIPPDLPEPDWNVLWPVVIEYPARLLNPPPSLPDFPPDIPEPD